MSNKNIISDTFNVSGKRLGDFFKWLEALDNATSFVATKCGSSIWYLQNGEISEGKLSLVEYDGVTKHAPVKRYKYSLSSVEINTGGIVASEEIRKNKTPLVRVPEVDSALFIEEHLPMKLGYLLGFAGTVFDKQSPERDMFIASLFQNSKKDCTLVIREQDGWKKIIDIRSKRYLPLPQTTLKTLYNEIISSTDWGVVDVSGWNIDHGVSYCDVFFPDLKEYFKEEYDLSRFMTPGIRLSTSSTGKGSMRVQELWLSESGRILEGEKFSRRHVGSKSIDVESEAKKAVDELTETCKTSVFSKYSAIPEALSELFAIKVANAGDIVTLKKVIRKVMTKVGIIKILGNNQRTSEIIENFAKSFILYDVSGYDLAMELLDFTSNESFKIAKSYKVMIDKCLLNVPQELLKFLKKSEKPTSKVFEDEDEDKEEDLFDLFAS